MVASKHISRNLIEGRAAECAFRRVGCGVIVREGVRRRTQAFIHRQMPLMGNPGWWGRTLSTPFPTTHSNQPVPQGNRHQCQVAESLENGWRRLNHQILCSAQSWHGQRQVS